MSLFEASEAVHRRAAQPLAARMRPSSLDEFVGQRHFLGEGKLLRRLLAADRLGSVIFYGPPGTGKTTLARLLATESRSAFRQLSAVSSGVKDLRDVLDEARDRLSGGGAKTLLFVDELHRFNKSQQDALLPDVEEGIVTLVGATTENPFFTVNSALVSRSRVFQFEPLSVDDIKSVVRRAMADQERGLGAIDIRMDDDALEFLAEVSDGDARIALGVLEIGVLSTDERPVRFTRALAEESVQRKAVRYDRAGDEHYDAASALIKSIRGSDPDAGLYWLARMLEGGEDVRFLCRRLVILASEDVGNADPHALPLAVAAMPGLCDPDDVPEPPDEAITKPGDLITLGEHRLYCGDSSKPDDVDRLLGGAVIHLVNTDPPYNVKVEPRSNNAIAAGLSSFKGPTHHQGLDLAWHPSKSKPTQKKLRAKDRPLANDFVSGEAFDNLLAAWFGNIARVLAPGRGFHIWGGYANLGNYPPFLKKHELYFSQSIVWDKEHPVLTRKDPSATRVERVGFAWERGEVAG